MFISSFPYQTNNFSLMGCMPTAFYVLKKEERKKKKKKDRKKKTFFFFFWLRNTSRTSARLPVCGPSPLITKAICPEPVFISLVYHSFGESTSTLWIEVKTRIKRFEHFIDLEKKGDHPERFSSNITAMANRGIKNPLGIASIMAAGAQVTSHNRRPLKFCISW